MTTPTRSPAPPRADAVLAGTRAALLPALRAAVDRLDPATRAAAAYHLGWADEAGRPTGSDGGKGVRGALALLSARAVGAPVATGLPGAVAVELVHNFSLLHDDLMDGDTERRHRPTVWARFGVASAVLTGDAMLALATEVLLDAATAPGARAAHLLARTTRELVRGQVEDVSFEHRRDVTPEACRAMAAGKTGALLSTSAAIGAVLADATDAQVQALGRYGCEVGAAFQLVDDLLGVWGDPAVTGKPVLADLRARKMSLPVTWALARGGPGAGEFAAWCARPPGADTEADLRRAAALLERCGARDWARAEADACGRRALAALASADLDAAAAEELAVLAGHLARREA